MLFLYPFTDAREEIREIRNEIKPEEFFIYYQQPQGQEFYRKIEKIILFLKYVINLIQTFRDKTFVAFSFRIY